MADHGQNPDGSGVHHTPHGEHPDHDELARLHTEGWFVGQRIREGHEHGSARLHAFLAGFSRGLEVRNDD